MAPRIYLSLAFHNHQPVGNFGWVFEEAFKTSYLPMVECLERHPTIRLALHYTGPLRDWIIENQPDFFPRLRKLVERRQIEIMTGGYYEPVLASLQDADKIGQIGKQTDSVREDFGYEATGLWLAERVWEPHLPRPLNMAGVRYTIVDDSHFKAVGYGDDDLLGYYVTEEQGHPLKIFATSMPLRYAIPWKSIEDVITWLREQSEAENSRYLGRVKVAVMGDDGEKFGLWPGTHDHVWVKGWMDRFFEAVEENSDWLGTIPPGEFARDHLSLGRIYLPTSSYDEMGEWVLPPDGAWELPHLKHELQAEGRTDITRYLRGGLWRQFMVKYPEVNQLHKKALWVSRKVHAMPDGPDKNRALDHLWAGQCNCGYWHGVFGGIYLFHIREADYRHLIAAENLADGVNPGTQAFARIEVADFDHDSIDDTVITTDRQEMIFDPDEGGGLVEWDFRPAAYNLVNVLTRRREGYHRDLVAAAAAGVVVTSDMEADERDAPESIHSTTVRAREPDLHEKLLYDWHRRAMLIDHFLHESATLDSFYRSQYREQGDFANQPYEQQVRQIKDGVAVTLRRDGRVWQGTVALPVTVEKLIQLEAGSDVSSVRYVVRNGEAGELNLRFGVETNWGFAGGNQDGTYLRTGFGRYRLGEIAENGDIDEFTITSELWGIEATLSASKPATLWRFPLEAISNSEGGFERNYQGTTILLWWPIKLAPSANWEATLTLTLNQIQDARS